ncbi:MAG: hypothetical protein Tsb0020_08340 [Haliangiales bacterium]
MNSEQFTVEDLPEGSILYVSINVAPDHPLRESVHRYMDPPPDLDLGRLTRSLGPGSRRYFASPVIDGTIDDLPENLSEYRALIIGCSGHSANLDRGPLAPWQERVLKLIQRAVHDYKLPYLGICGGGQLGLVALGGAVGPNPAGVGFKPEEPGSLLIRTTEVTLTEAGQNDPLFEGCATHFGMTAIHADYMSEAPPDKGFVPLAHSADVPNQALAYGDRVRLLGLHPEVTREFLDDTIGPVLDAGAFAVAPRSVLDETFAAICPTPSENAKIIRNFMVNFATRKWA